jgi:hypothetical protein
MPRSRAIRFAKGEAARLKASGDSAAINASSARR